MVEAGGERRQGAGLVVGVVAVVAALALGLSSLRDEPAAPDATPAPSAPAAAGTAPPTSAAPEPSPLRGEETTEVEGRVVAVGLGAAYVLDLSTGAHRPLETGPARFAVAAGGSVVLYGGDRATDFPPPDAPMFAVGPDLRVRRLGTAGEVVPAADRKGVWAQRWTRDGTGSTVRYVSLAGQPGAVYEPDAFDALRAAMPGGQFVVADLQSGGLDVWKWRDRWRVHREPWMGFVAANSNRVVWADQACERPCPVFWFDFPNLFSGDGCECGHVETPLDTYPHAGALSPDGRWLALQATGNRVAVTVCDLARSRCTRLRNAVADDLFQAAWLPDSSALVLAAPPGAEQVAVWRPGWTEVRVIPGRHTVVSMAALGS